MAEYSEKCIVNWIKNPNEIDWKQCSVDLIEGHSKLWYCSQENKLWKPSHLMAETTVNRPIIAV